MDLPMYIVEFRMGIEHLNFNSSELLRVSKGL